MSRMSPKIKQGMYVLDAMAEARASERQEIVDYLEGELFLYKKLNPKLIFAEVALTKILKQLRDKR